MSDWHEIRDPVHEFIIFNRLERSLIDTRPVQRLRQIKQLSTSYLVYPGAIHTRFEHALGTMELASRLFDVIELKGGPRLRALMNWGSDAEIKRYRQILRLGALLHDVGHAPFSHGAEELMPKSMVHHENYSEAFIKDSEIGDLIASAKPFGITADEVAAVALGPKLRPTSDATMLLLGEIVTGELGVDRMDYLLRDSLHAGVAYGRFDHHRLINTITVVQHPDTGSPVLAVEHGGLHAAEGLIIARYFMFKQVYYHHVRAIYDIHLIDFLKSFLPTGRFPDSLSDYLAITDTRIHEAITSAANNPTSPSHDQALRLEGRKHYRRAYEVLRIQLKANPMAFKDLEIALRDRFGDAIRTSEPTKKASTLKDGDLPILLDDGRVVDVLEMSELIPKLAEIWSARVYADKQIWDDVQRFCSDFMEAGGASHVG